RCERAAPGRRRLEVGMRCALGDGRRQAQVHALHGGHEGQRLLLRIGDAAPVRALRLDDPDLQRAPAQLAAVAAQRMLKIAAVVVGVARLLAGCSGGHKEKQQPPAQPLSAQNPVSAAMPPSSPAEYRAPIRIYRRHVLRQLGEMSGDVTALRAAIAAGDESAARSAWRAANAHYQTIGAAYGAFGDLDAAVDGTTAGLPRGERDPHFTGLHRVELALFGRDSLADAAGPAATLQRSLAHMRARLPKLEI